MLVQNETLKVGAAKLIGCCSVRMHQELGQTCWWFVTLFDLGLELLNLQRNERVRNK